MSLAAHLALRYLRRRRAAWLALAACACSVAMSVLVVGITQGWLDQVERSFRAAEAELTARPWGGERDTPALRATVAGAPGVAGIAPYLGRFGFLVSRSDPDRKEETVHVEGIELAADLAIGRLQERNLHPPPVTDLAAPAIPAEERGSGFLTAEARAVLALAGLDLAAGLGAAPLPAPPATRPPPGVILGREFLYGSGIRVGERVQLTLPASGPRPGVLVAEVSDTIATGVLQLDQMLALLPLSLARQVTGRPGQLDGYRLALAPGADRRAVARAVRDASGLGVRSWEESRGINAVRMIESNRNLVLVLMLAIEAICILFVYSVFSTLVAEKRRDLGILLCLGARRGDLMAAVLLMGLIAGVAGAALGWAAGWGLLAVINPLSEACGIPLFPMEIFYSAEAPISFDPAVPLTYGGLMIVVSLVAAILPAWSARSTDPIAIVREGG